MTRIGYAAGCCAAALAAGSVFGRDCGAALLSDYVRRFNADDEECYTNAIPNAAAADWMLENCPRFTCPDKEIERTYYFRWWTLRKHLRHDLGVWTISEFLPNVSWAQEGNMIVCAAGHHLHEARWLRDPKYATECARFWLADKRAVRRWLYSSWLYSSVRDLAAVSGDDALPGELLDAAVAFYRRWERGFVYEDGKPMGGDGKGGFLSIDNHEGTEYSLGGSGYKPLFTSAMWAEAQAIAEVARQAGRTDLADEFARKAETVRQSLFANCWNDDIRFFTTANIAPPNADVSRASFRVSHSPVRELHGYAPWYFGVPTDGRAPDWSLLSDPQGFRGTYGLTFPERRAQGFALSYSGHECQWNGPSWPFATSVALTALANDLHRECGARDASKGKRQPSSADRNLFTSLLHQYAVQHRLTRADGSVVPWIDENLNPDTGDWIARTMLRKNAKNKIHERGKDYNHATFCDLVISGLVGFRPKADGTFAVEPLFPETWDYLDLENLRYRGQDVSVRWRRGTGLTVTVDGREVIKPRRPGAVEVDFARGKWDPEDWTIVKGPRWDYCHGFVQKDGWIENETPEGLSPEEIFKTCGSKVYSGMVRKEKFPLGTALSMTTGWDWRMAPLMVIAPELGVSKDGKHPEFREHWEIVVYDEGLNVWHHFWTPEKGPHWIKAASLTLPKDRLFKPNVRHTLKVRVFKNAKGRRAMVCECNGYVLQYVDDALPDSFYAGILGCEGRNFFWDFSAKP